jgi:hypothetical protein
LIHEQVITIAKLVVLLVVVVRDVDHVVMVGIRNDIVVIVTFLFQFLIPALSIAYELQYLCSVPIDLILVYSRDLSKFGQVYLISAFS